MTANQMRAVHRRCIFMQRLPLSDKHERHSIHVELLLKHIQEIKTSYLIEFPESVPYGTP